eukprot:353281-Chlamydomonas_euryale.AAC.4
MHSPYQANSGQSCRVNELCMDARGMQMACAPASRYGRQMCASQRGQKVGRQPSTRPCGLCSRIGQRLQGEPVAVTQPKGRLRHC